MLIDLAATRHADELRETWQGRLLAKFATQPDRVPSNEIQAVILSILAHCYDDTDVMPTLLRVLFPGFETIRPPFICSIAHVDHAGRVVADTMNRDGYTRSRDTLLFSSLHEFQTALRNIADYAKLADDERIEFFKCARLWCPADHRLDPMLDPADPDAKRFRYH